MRTYLRASFVLAIAFCVPDGRASTIDQSNTVTIGALGSSINECCAFIAQTYTAGLSGTLAGVSVDIHEFSGFDYPLDVQIRTASGEIPTFPILGEAITTHFSLSDVIAFSQVIPQVAGTQYAIVVHFVGTPLEGAGQGVGVWAGTTGNPYPGGSGVDSLDYGITWPLTGDFANDLHFVTYVNSTSTPEPRTWVLMLSGILAFFAMKRQAGLFPRLKASPTRPRAPTSHPQHRS